MFDDVLRLAGSSAAVEQSRRGNETDILQMIDPDGYRPNVGIVLTSDHRQVFWARRVTRDGWQFPQGGMRSDETPEEAMFRELREEVGLKPEHVQVLGATPGWLRYRLPERLRRNDERLPCVGQKQVWFLLKMKAAEAELKLDGAEEPEFDAYRWVDYWYPVKHVVHFKRSVYRRALRTLEPMLDLKPGSEQSATIPVQT